MNISKTLFKNLTRCKNFISYYDLYVNRYLHEVKSIDDMPISKQNIEEMTQLKDGLFTEEDDRMSEIFEQMFDEQSGEDLTNITNPQLEAFSKIFTEVERLASMYVEKMFGKKVVASTNTYDQKKFSYTIKGHKFYCYLDIYLEDEDSIKIFEVKATTSRKYDHFSITFNKQKIPFFENMDGKIMKYVGNDIFSKNINGKPIDEKRINKKKEKLFDRFSDEGKYIYDIAVERHIIEHAIDMMEKKPDKKIEYYLVVLNANYHFDGTYDENNKPIYNLDKNGEALFKIYDMNYLTKEYQDMINVQRDQILDNLDNLTIHTNILSKACEYKKTTQCKFCNICMKKVLKPGSILEYLNKNYAFSKLDDNGKRKILDVYHLINTKHYLISDCLEYLTKPENIVQYNCYVNNDIYVDKKRITEAIHQISYPIYHLDFESYNSPLPRFFGERPYEQSLFQYSLHKEIKPGVCDLIKDHSEFLAKDHQDYRKKLAEQLIHDINLSKGGCVMVYNKSFEKTRLKELANLFPEYKEKLDDINHHIFDLLEVLRGSSTLSDNHTESDKPRFTYYNNLMHGSFSIKKVLPIFTNLSYHTLEVKNGTEAIVTYGMLDQLTEKEYEEKYLALRVYCRQDTWAMVEILRGLRKLVKDK